MYRSLLSCGYAYASVSKGSIQRPQPTWTRWTSGLLFLPLVGRHPDVRRRLIGRGGVFAFCRSTHTTSSDDHNRTPMDCPLCRHYGEGPCAEAFWKWYHCASRNQDDGPNPMNAADTRCAQEYQAFSACLGHHDDEEHEESIGDEVANEDETAARLEAWQIFYETEMALLEPHTFAIPLTIHTDSHTNDTKKKQRIIVIEVPATDLVAVLVHRHDTLLAAASKGELPVLGATTKNGATQARCLLRLVNVPTTTTTTTTTVLCVSAIYEDDSESGVLLRQAIVS